MRQLRSISRIGLSALSATLLLALPTLVVGLEQSLQVARVAGSRDRQLPAAGVKTIDLTASRFKFDPATISVVEGDSVQLRLRSADRDHAFAIKAFRVKTVIPKGGDVVTVEFVADKTGTFDFTCAEYCGTGHSAMKGRLIVTAREK
jgi:cytochrome c oxidase subunit 2